MPAARASATLRSCSAWIFWRRLSDTRNDAARKIDENVPWMMPMTCTSARSFRVPTPSMPTAMTISAMIGSSDDTVVLIERMIVWFTARLTCSA